MLSERELADVLVVVDASTAPATKAAYGSDWARFTGWAAERGFAPLPAAPLVVAHYVTEAAAEQTGVGRWRYTPATLTRWVSSINQFHTAAGLDAPGRSEVVRRALSGVRRIRATPPARKSPLLLDDVRTLLQHLAGLAGNWPAGVAARRDAALLVMGFAGAYRRSELTALTLADVTLHRTDGLHVRSRPVEDRPGGPRCGEGAAVRAGPGDVPALRVCAVAGSAARLRHRPRRRPAGAAEGGDAGAPPTGRTDRAERAAVGEGSSRRRIARCCMSAGPPGSPTPMTRGGCCSRRCTRPG